jgi:hypothetical protein
MVEQIATFARVIDALDARETAAIGKPQPEPRGLLQALIARLRPH